jgi:hypothetical protein
MCHPCRPCRLVPRTYRSNPSYLQNLAGGIALATNRVSHAPILEAGSYRAWRCIEGERDISITHHASMPPPGHCALPRITTWPLILA